MPPTNSDRILELEKLVTTHKERLSNIGKEIARIEGGGIGAGQQLADIDKRLLLVESNLARLERRFDEVLSRRWELWKIVLAAFLGSILALATSFVGRYLDRLIVDVRPATSETR